ncbi:MAG: hypothetical protein V7609_1277 [Verrucomicrobiota bacterium]
MTLTLQVVAPILTAMVAALVSFIVTVMSKEQKTSEFRQAWIDSLREDLSQFAALMLLIEDSIQEHVSVAKEKADDARHLITERFEEYKLAESLRIKLFLRLNPQEHIQLIDLIERIHLFDRLRDPPEVGTALFERLIDESQVVLKREWKRVKRGEWTFFVTKWFSLIIFITALILAMLLSHVIL